MTCSEFEELILDRIDGRIAADATRLLESHLEVCEHCRAFEAVQQELDLSLSRGAPLAPPGFAASVRGLIQPDRPHPMFTWDLAGLTAVAGAGAFCMLHWLPGLLVGGPWVAAGIILCAGMTLVARTEV